MTKFFSNFGLEVDDLLNKSCFNLFSGEHDQRSRLDFLTMSSSQVRVAQSLGLGVNKNFTFWRALGL